MVIKISPTNVPPLNNGDHLTRDEFERRYEAMPTNIKAELIEGVVYMASPVSDDYHAHPHSLIVYWIVHYSGFTPCVYTGIDGTVRLDSDNELQPDVYLYIAPAKGGQIVKEGGYVVNGPELVIEIAASTVEIDMKKKLPVYRRNKVREYIVWRIYDEAIDWFVLRNGEYEPISEAEAGVRKSEVFPGLWLDSAALLRGDITAIRETLDRGVASPEHAEFVKRLSS